MRGIVAGAIAIAVAGCASMQASGPRAVADLAPTKGNTARGTVTFTTQGDRVRVVADLSGLTPGAHGFHVHEKGDCSADDAMSAGGHFNPESRPHGAPNTPERHTGDLPMLTADAEGRARLDATVDLVALGSGSRDIIGKGLIVHKDPDDYKTQPTGNSGARVACGVIRAA